jgi:hypothetical protein
MQLGHRKAVSARLSRVEAALSCVVRRVGCSVVCAAATLGNGCSGDALE